MASGWFPVITHTQFSIIHATLQDDGRVYTYSEGQDPYRYVVIDLKENDQE